MKPYLKTKNGWLKTQSFESVFETCSPQRKQVQPSDHLKLYSNHSSTLRLEHSLAQICRLTHTKMVNPDSRIQNKSEVHLRKQYLVEHQKCQQHLLEDLRVGKENTPNNRYFRETKLTHKRIKGSEGKLVKKRQIVLPSIITYSVQQALTKSKYKKPIEALIPKQIIKDEVKAQKSQKKLSPIKKTERHETQYDTEITTRSKQLDDEKDKGPKRGSLQLDNSIFEEQERLGNQIRQYLSKYKKKLH